MSTRTTFKSVGQYSRAGKGSAFACIFFAVHAHFAFPKERQNAHELQKIFPVAAGDHAQADKVQGNATIAPTV
jgi:hypothetical protein